MGAAGYTFCQGIEAAIGNAASLASVYQAATSGCSARVQAELAALIVLNRAADLGVVFGEITEVELYKYQNELLASCKMASSDYE
jgi:hypothetical protein